MDRDKSNAMSSAMSIAINCLGRARIGAGAKKCGLGIVMGQSTGDDS